jgi:hypothetical protein
MFINWYLFVHKGATVLRWQFTPFLSLAGVQKSNTPPPPMIFFLLPLICQSSFSCTLFGFIFVALCIYFTLLTLISPLFFVFSPFSFRFSSFFSYPFHIPQMTSADISPSLIPFQGEVFLSIHPWSLASLPILGISVQYKVRCGVSDISPFTVMQGRQPWN